MEEVVVCEPDVWAPGTENTVLDVVCCGHDGYVPCLVVYESACLQERIGNFGSVFVVDPGCMLMDAPIGIVFLTYGIAED